MMKRILCHIIVLVAVFYSHHIDAQEFSLEYDTEIQTDFRKAANWVNLLRMGFSCPVAGGLSLNLSTISIAKTLEGRLIDDFQTFSNIEEDNLPFALSLAGMEWQCGTSMLFVGIRSMNEDYFTTPVTSLFTNSSCGIFPTISANAPVPNYPLAALGIHYAFSTEHWQAQASLYNGTAHNRFTRRQNIFRFCPASDGLFGIISFNYRNNGSNYNLGGTLHHGLPVLDSRDVLPQETQKEKMVSNISLWVYAEQQLLPSLHALLQFSASPSPDADCSTYIGAGFVLQCRKMRIGIFSNHARFSYGKEWATEATVNIPLTSSCSLQPALHCIRTACQWNCVCLLRLVCSLK